MKTREQLQEVLARFKRMVDELDDVGAVLILTTDIKGGPVDVEIASNVGPENLRRILRDALEKAPN